MLRTEDEEYCRAGNWVYFDFVRRAAPYCAQYDEVPISLLSRLPCFRQVIQDRY